MLVRPTAFVAWLFIMAGACVVIAVGDRSIGWFIGSGVFFLLGLFARGQLKKEQEVGREPPRLGFVGAAMVAMLVIMGALFWLQTSA